jgi:molybdopterin/thiamine biosynthesis adenylyltransferase
MGAISKRRLLRELEAIESRYPTMRLRSLDIGRPTFEGTVEVDGDVHHVRLTLPPSYPAVPPELREFDAETKVEVPPRGRGNRLDRDGLCLFPHGNDSQGWRRDRLAADALDRFRQLIRHEREQTGLYRASVSLHVPPQLVLATQLGPGSLRVRHAKFGGDLFTAKVCYDRAPELDYVTLDEKWETFLPTEFVIPWFILITDKPWSELAGSRALLDESLRAHLPEAVYLRQRSEQWLVVLKQAELGANFDLRCFNRPAGNVSMLLQAEVLSSMPSDLLFHRVDGVVANRDALENETVVIVGLGSLGGALALALARAGIRRFVLIDPDTLAIENVCRHVGTLRDLGRPKVDIVRDMIASVNPDAVVESIPKWLAWDLPWLGAGAWLEARLANGGRHTLVSTCVEATAERELSALALEHGVPIVYSSVLGAADHGRIFRVMRGQTPCYECVRAAQAAEPSKYFSLGTEPEGRPAYVDPGLPGLGIDITQVALITARFVLQTVAETRGVELGLPPESGHHLLWTNRGGWLFDRPLQLIVEDFPRSPKCPACSPAAEPEALDDTEQARLTALITELRAEVP